MNYPLLIGRRLSGFVHVFRVGLDLDNFMLFSSGSFLFCTVLMQMGTSTTLLGAKRFFFLLLALLVVN